jgi:aryl-alcohol dehydrogenase-like predicted oxidoreductase
MNSNRLGKSGIVVSDICMGTMTFGNQADEKTAFRIMDMAYDAGVDFYDTAEMYPVPPDAKYVGATEVIVDVDWASEDGPERSAAALLDR